MNSQDIYNLSEAYLDVYENQQLEEVYQEPRFGKKDYIKKLYKRGGMGMGTPKDPHGYRDPKMAKVGAEFSKRITAAAKAKKTGKPDSYRAEKEAQSKLKKEEIDLYDIILSHLLDEGYAETPEAAEVIMVNMSEDWRESIVEVSLKTKINAYAATQDPDDDSNERLSQGEKIMKSIVKKHGKKAGEHADAHAQSSHWGRTDSRTGKRQERPVPRSSSPAGKSYESQKRTTQSGKMNKTDQKTLKSKLQRRASERKSGETSSTHHPSFYHR